MHYLCILIQASSTDEAIALLLFEWAVSKYRVGKFRALAVAKILQRRQTEILDEVRHKLYCTVIMRAFLWENPRLHYENTKKVFLSFY